jgi:acetylserotonin N-methyltransferase
MTMTPDLPTTDDRPVWDVWLSMFWLPAVSVADELGVFESLGARPAAARELAQRLGFDERAVEILLPLVTSLGFLVSHSGCYHLSDAGRNFFLRSSRFYWGHVFPQVRSTNPIHASLKAAVTTGRAIPVSQSSDKPAVEAWESGVVDLERARTIAAFMHSHSLPAAAGVAHNADFAGVARLLDVGGGSGCFAIALAERHPEIRCTVMDLEAMCRVAEEYVAAAGLNDRIDTRTVDMFRQDWPSGYDAMFFSNIFHDWSAETCAGLAAKAFAALVPGGRICLHEMLLDDSGAAPRAAAAFSVLMLLGTRGRQYTYAQLETLLEAAGFVDVDVIPTYGYYSVVRGFKR